MHDINCYQMIYIFYGATYNILKTLMKRVNIVAEKREDRSWAESLSMKQYIEVHF